jgi:hypothetical protein
VRWMHREFYRDAPASLLTIDHPSGPYLMVPGEFRSEPRHEVTVGRHRPPSSHRVPDFMGHKGNRNGILGPNLGSRSGAQPRFCRAGQTPRTDSRGSLPSPWLAALLLSAGSVPDPSPRAARARAHGTWAARVSGPHFYE